MASVLSPVYTDMTWQWIYMSQYLHNTFFSAAFCAVPGLTNTISHPSSTATHVSISQGPSSGVYVVLKLLRRWHTDWIVCYVLDFFLSYLHKLITFIAFKI
jgi:hypothetical protein